MEDTVKQRIMEFIRYRGISQRSFERACGLSNGYLIQLRNAPSSDKLSMILKAFPEINRTWLLSGDGEMLNADISRPRAVDPEINGRIKEISDKLFGGDLSRMAMATYIQKSKLREIVNDSRYPDYSEILNIIAMAKPARIVADWLLTGEGDMLKSVTPSDSRPEVQTRPRIPTTAAAGSLSGDAASVTLRDCEQLPVISQLPAYDFTIIIKGDSMKPKYESGDEIACRRILNPSFIQWGKVHVLDTVQGIVVKKVYDDGDCIKCVSINPDYPPFSVPKDEVYSLSLVVGSLSITEM